MPYCETRVTILKDLTIKPNELVLDNVHKSYVQGSRSIDVLHNVSASFQQGKSYAITGVSGSGKSTLLYILGGFEVPTSGTVRFNQTNIFTLTDSAKEHFRNQTVGFVFQFHYLVKELTVLDNIALMGIIKGLKKQECLDYAHELLLKVGLQHRANHYPTELSGGEQQRVAVLRAVFNKPQFLFADEPTGSLDAHNAGLVMDLFMKMHEELGVGLILCSHDKAVYESMGIQYALHEGQLNSDVAKNS